MRKDVAAQRIQPPHPPPVRKIGIVCAVVNVRRGDLAPEQSAVDLARIDDAVAGFHFMHEAEQLARLDRNGAGLEGRSAAGESVLESGALGRQGADVLIHIPEAQGDLFVFDEQRIGLAFAAGADRPDSMSHAKPAKNAARPGRHDHEGASCDMIADPPKPPVRGRKRWGVSPAQGVTS